MNGKPTYASVCSTESADVTKIILSHPEKHERDISNILDQKNNKLMDNLKCWIVKDRKKFDEQSYFVMRVSVTNTDYCSPGELIIVEPTIVGCLDKITCPPMMFMKNCVRTNLVNIELKNPGTIEENIGKTFYNGCFYADGVEAYKLIHPDDTNKWFVSDYEDTLTIIMSIAKIKATKSNAAILRHTKASYQE